MLRELGVESIELMTNNPLKLDGLRELGIRVEKRVPMLVAANPFSAPYLEVKRKRMQHEIPSNALASEVAEAPPDDGSGEPAPH
jgi:GTP cyclohydrolase II